MQRVCLGLVLALTWGVTPASAQHGAAKEAPKAATSEHGAEHAGDTQDAHGHGPKYELLTVDGMTAVWTILIFVSLLVILRATAWKPIQTVLVEREKFISDSLQQAKRDRAEAEARLKEYLAKLDTAKQEATAIVEEGRRDAEVLRRRIEAEAKAEADRQLERARREIGIATDTAVKELCTLGSKLATDVASRIIQKELNAKEHERLISESIEQLGSAMAAGRR